MATKDITLTIDGASVTVPEGTTILKAAEQLGREVPTICSHDHCTANGLCRIRSRRRAALAAGMSQPGE